MEQHAVPQDITGFKFKLVGDMTLKQFGELAFGAIMAYLFFVSNFHPIVKWPLVLFFIILGVALAFMPIQERPLDSWIINFFKAIYKPTFFTWRRGAQTAVEKPPEVTKNFIPLTTDTTVTPLMAAGNVVQQPVEETKIPVPPPPPPPPPAQGVVSIEELLKQRHQQTPAVTESDNPALTVEDLMQQREHSAVSTSEKSASELSAAEEKLSLLSEKNKELMMKVDLLRDQIYKIGTSGGDATKLQPELDKLLSEKDQVYKEVGKARDEMTLQKVAPLTNPAYKEPAIDMSFLTRPKPEPKPLTISFTNQPNVVNGLVLDPNGVPLNGVIITVKDKDGNSIRALRTSRMGQFIAGTPLVDGEYYLELEKAGHEFDVWKISLNGTQLAPVQIRAKGG